MPGLDAYRAENKWAQKDFGRFVCPGLLKTRGP
jgi:hypothetical protein